MKKILVICYGSLQDVLHTTPIVRALKVQLEPVEIHYSTRHKFDFLLEENPYIKKIITDNVGRYALIRKLRAEDYDQVIDLQYSQQSRLVSLLLGKATFATEKIDFKKWLMVRFKHNRLPNKHIVFRHFEAVHKLGIEPDSLGLDYFIPERDTVPTEWLPETHRASCVVFAIGAAYFTRKLPVKRMIELCDKINKPIILIGGQEDEKTAALIYDFFERKTAHEHLEEGLLEMNKKAQILNMVGKLNMNQEAHLIQHASHIFTHDSIYIAIAAAFKKNIFSIWGNTIPSFGEYPFKTKFTVFENNKLNCRPCAKTGYQKCPLSHFKCMNDIVFDFYLP